LTCSVTSSEIHVAENDFDKFEKTFQICIEDAIILAPDQIPEVIDLLVQYTTAALRSETPAVIPRLLKVFTTIMQHRRIIDAVLRMESPRSNASETSSRVSFGLDALGMTLEKVGLAVDFYNRGVNLAAESRYGEARRTLTQSLDWSKASPIEPKALVVLTLRARGLVQVSAGNYRGALRDFEKALSVRPDHEPTLVDAASTLLKLGRYKKALARVETLLEINSQDVSGLLTRGRVLAALERDWEALKSFSEALEISPGNTAVIYHRMLAHVTNHRWILAARDLCALLSANAPELAYCEDELIVEMFSSAISECHRTVPNSDEPQRFLEEWEKVCPGTHQVLAARAQFHAVNGRIYEALRDVTSAIEINDRQSHYFALRGHLYESVKQSENAALDYARARDLDRYDKKPRG
jgi:tetratricopeptide (TPR) repeat protein